MKKQERQYSVQSAGSLRAIVSRVKQYCARMDACASVMEEASAEELLVGNAAAVDRFLADLNRWSRACESALDVLMRGSGKFGAMQPPHASKRCRKATAKS